MNQAKKRIVLVLLSLVCSVSLVDATSMETLIHNEAVLGFASLGSMWIEPATLTVPGVVGYQFNVSVWAATMESCYAWQIQMMFNSDYFAVAAAGFLGDNSALFAGHPYFMGGPFIRSNIVLFAESLINNDSRPAGVGSLAWVEFNVTAVSSDTQTFNINNNGTTIVDSATNPLPITISDATLTMEST